MTNAKDMYLRTLDVHGLGLLALSDSIVHLALDDGVVLGAREALQLQLCAVVSGHDGFVYEPPVSHLVRVGVRLAMEHDVLALDERGVIGLDGHVRSVLHQ